MKYSFFFLVASIGILAACSGFEKDVMVEATDDVEISKVIFNVQPVIDDDAIGTRASAVPQSDNNVSFAWEEADRIGIFPNKGSQIYFVPEDGIGTNSASFDGGGWALKSNSTYISYYPFVADFDLDRSAIPISFTGQIQKGIEGPFEGERWVLATGSTTSQNGVLTFKYEILNTIINVIATLPAGTYTKASLNISEPLFVEEGTFSLDGQSFTGTTFSKRMEIALEDFTLASTGTVPIYFMAAPVDLTGKEIKVTVTRDDGASYSCVKTPSGPYNPGRRRGLTCDQMQKDAEIINFVDPEVKRICVENWDTDGDGELDMDEAAAVTDLPEYQYGSQKIFYGNRLITSFDELRHFTGLSEIPRVAFTSCSNLVSITLPESIIAIGRQSFYGCTSLSSINIPNSVSTIGDGAFSGCTSLTHFDIPEGVEISLEALSGTKINSINVPSCTLAFNNPDSPTLMPFGDCSSITYSGSISIQQYRGPVFITPSLTSLYFDRNFTVSWYKKINGEWVTRDDSRIYIQYNMLSGYRVNNLDTIAVSPDNTLFDSRGDCNALIETATNTLVVGAKTTVIPESVTAIGSRAFSNLNYSSPFSITVPASVKNIGDEAFMPYDLDSSTNPYSITFLSTEPPTLESPSYAGGGYYVFGPSGESVYPNLCIYVPAGSLNAYKTAVGWSEYADRIFSVESGTVPGPGNDGND